jgi:hypothetical protein
VNQTPAAPSDTASAGAGTAGGVAGGVALLLGDLTVRGARALVLTDDPEHVEAVAVRADRVDIGRVADAPAAPAVTGGRPNVTVLDAEPAALLAAGGERYDLVAWLEPLGGPEAGAVAEEQVDVLDGLLRPGGVLVVGAASGPALREALAGHGRHAPSPAGAERTGAVTSAALLREALARAGRPRPVLHALFGAPEVQVVVDEDAARAARSGSHPVDLLTAVVEPGLRGAVVAVADAGLLEELADGWVAVVGGRGRPLYAHDVRLGWLGADPAAAPWTYRRLPDGTAGPFVGAVNLESALLGSLAAGDLVGFRRLAGLAAEHVRRGLGSGPAPAGFDRLFVSGDRVGPGLELRTGGAAATRDAGQGDGAAAASAPRDADDVLAVWWLRFADRCSEVPPAPWDRWKTRRARVEEWLALSGVADAAARLDRLVVAAGKEVSEEGVDAVPVGPASAVGAVDVAALEERLAASAAALAVRDARLRHREAYIRRLRHAWGAAERDKAEAEAALERLRSSTTYRTGRRVELVRHPREAAGLLARRAGKGARRAARILRS